MIYGPPSSPGITLPWNGVDSWPAHLQRSGVTADLQNIFREHGLDSLTRPADVAGLRSLKMPVLIVTGDSEVPYFRLAADALHYAIPGSTRAFVAGGGHMVHLVAPESFNRVLLSFLAQFPTL